ncbi:MAG: phosphate acetyltransferase [Bacilli bacterium]|nr:phosphate acetyltransferase [Bacilli bacterium]
MGFIDNIKERAKTNLKTIVLPESMDRRVLEAAEIASKEKIAKIIIIGNEIDIEANNSDLDLSETTIIDPNVADITEELINKLVEVRKNKGLSYEEAKKLILEDYMYFACMLVKTGRADGVVSGACHSSSNTLRPALQIIKADKDVPLVSAFFLMVVPDCEYGANGTFVFADSGLVQNPTSEELAAIAATSAKTFELLVESEPIVALLSHSTKGSAEHADVTKVVEAVKIAKEKYSNYRIDGELQLDAAIVPDVAAFKAPDSTIAGLANVLIFPDLDAGNIGYKLVERLAKAEAYGPITQGIAAPINDLSRGCNVHDIVGVIAITAVQAQKK